MKVNDIAIILADGGYGKFSLADHGLEQGKWQIVARRIAGRVRGQNSDKAP